MFDIQQSKADSHEKLIFSENSEFLLSFMHSAASRFGIN